MADADAATLVAPEVDDHAAALLGDDLHRRVELDAAVAAQRAEHVAGEALGVDPHEHVLLAGHRALHHGDVLLAVEERLVGVAGEVAPLRGDAGLGDPADELLVLAPVPDEVGDRDHEQAVLLGEPLELRDPGHVGLLVVDDLAEQRRAGTGRPCCRGRSVASVWPARLSTPPSRAISGLMWPGRARSPGRVRRIAQRLDGGAAVVGGDPGGGAVPVVDGDQERGAVALGVVHDHQREVELLGSLRRDRRAEVRPRCGGGRTPPSPAWRTPPP